MRIGLVTALLGALFATSRVDRPLTIVAALPDRGDLLIDEPFPLPWEDWLPADLRPEALRADRARRLALWAERSEEFRFTEVSFDRPLTPELAAQFYHLADSTGVRPLALRGLRGTARIRWLDSTGTAFRVIAFGHLLASDPPRTRGGLVLVADRRLELSTEPAHFTADQLLGPGDYPGRGTPFRDIIRQYRIRQAGPDPAEWVWFQWRPDTANAAGGCTLRLAIFRLAPGPVEQGQVNAECDV